MRCLIFSLLVTWCAALENVDDAVLTADDGLLSVALDLNTFLDNLLQCRNTHFHCLKNGGCQESFSRCVQAYPMLRKSTVQSLNINEDGQLAYGFTDKWKSAVSKVKSTIESVIGKGKDLVGKGKEKVKEIIEKVKKIKMTDILDPIKELVKTLKEVPAALKSLMEKIQSIPSLVSKSMKMAVEHCQGARQECKVGSSDAKRALCDIRFPACIPSYLSCNAIARPVMKACGKVTMAAVDAVCGFMGLAGDIGGMVCMLIAAIPGVLTGILCAGPAYILGGCPLASLPFKP